MIRVRRFSPLGIDAVRDSIDSHLGSIKKGSRGIPISENHVQVISKFSHDEKLLEKNAPSVYLDPTRKFSSSYELGKYLFEQFSGSDIDESDCGLWTWISIVYFEQLLEKNSSNEFLIGRSYRYVLELNNRLRYYRHLVYMPYYLFHRLRELSYVFLHSSLSVSGEFLAQAQKDAVVSNEKLVEMCLKYFFDAPSGKFSPGFTAQSGSKSLRRLVESIVPQLSVNYDIRLCSPDELYNLLPVDFRSSSFVRVS